MPTLPLISGREAVRAFEQAGWQVRRRRRGSHIILTKPGTWTSLSVPDHRELDRRLLAKLVKQAGLTVEEFVELSR